LLYAPVLPNKALRRLLLDDPGTHAALDLWGRASCALLSVGAPPEARQARHGSFSPPTTLAAERGRRHLRPLLQRERRTAGVSRF